jgi:hypothetical protein
MFSKEVLMGHIVNLFCQQRKAGGSMKKKIAVMVALTLLLVSLVSSVPAAASNTASALSPTIPSARISSPSLPSSTETKDIAVTDDGAVFLTNMTSTIYFSKGLGNKINKIKWYVRTAPAPGPYLIAAAPDNRDLVAIASTATNQVYLSKNSAFTFSPLGIPKQSEEGAASIIRDIAISTETSAGNRYIAVAGEEAGSYANVWYLDIGNVEAGWKETNCLPGFQATSSNSRAGAIAFSPNFAFDKVMLAITEQDDGSGGSADHVWLEFLSFNAEMWNLPLYGYPVTIASDTGITNLVAASLSLDPQCLGSDDTMPLAFMGLTLDGASSATAQSGIYRASDTQVAGLKTGAETDIYSLAFNGRYLVAGEYGSNTVYYGKKPLAPIPVVGTSIKPPRGEGMVVVAWAGRLVMAGTSGESGGFAISRNKGKSFKNVDLP